MRKSAWRWRWPYGRGKGQGKGNKEEGRTVPYTGKIHSGIYNPPLWKILDTDQKVVVYTLREAENG